MNIHAPRGSFVRRKAEAVKQHYRSLQSLGSVKRPYLHRALPPEAMPGS